MAPKAIPWIWLMLVLLLLESVLPQDLADEPEVLAHSDFLWDADGWTTSDSSLELVHDAKMIKAADKDEKIWYFVAPSKFLGAKRNAYGGKLSFRHGFYEYDSMGQDMIDSFDVILFSEAHDIEIGLRYVVPAWAFRSEHELELVESAGWTLKTTGDAPSKPDMLRLLSKLSGIWIRGGYYQGHEDSYIASVKLIAGPGDNTPKKTSLKAQHVVAGGKSTLKGEFASALPSKDDSDLPPPPPEDELSK